MSFKRTLAWLLVALVAVLSPTAGLSAAQSAEAQAGVYLDELWKASGTPGLSVAILVKGRLVLSEGRGFADLENMVPATSTTVYGIGPLSKVITAVAILQLVDRGAVGLDEVIQAYVP
jgi:CubicO group peptidase (beta-lactamase class C family)